MAGGAAKVDAAVAAGGAAKVAAALGLGATDGLGTAGGPHANAAPAPPGGMVGDGVAKVAAAASALLLLGEANTLAAAGLLTAAAPLSLLLRGDENTLAAAPGEVAAMAAA